MSEEIKLTLKKPPVITLEFNPEPTAKVEIARALVGKPGVGLPPGGDPGDIPKKQSETAYDIAWSKPPRLVTTPPLLIQNNRIQLPSLPLGDLFMDMAWVFVDVTQADILPNGLLVKRDYEIQEYINVIVDGQTAVFFGENGSIDGKYAKVSYLTWPQG